jgi:hypothetical protein
LAALAELVMLDSSTKISTLRLGMGSGAARFMMNDAGPFPRQAVRRMGSCWQRLQTDDAILGMRQEPLRVGKGFGFSFFRFFTSFL